MQKILVSININTGTYKKFIDDIFNSAGRQSRYICVANVHMVIEAYGNSYFAAVVNRADIVTPDGMPITWALNWLYNIKQERIAGMDLLPDILSGAEERSIPVYFYGGTEEMMQSVRDIIPLRYPYLKIAGTYSPPFREITVDEAEFIIKMINSSGAGIVFVILGCPKQEMWMGSMKDKVNATMIGIGGALPVLLGIQKRAPAWMQNIGLEWLYRLMLEPRRLFKRYAFTNALFIYLLVKELIKRKVLKRTTN